MKRPARQTKRKEIMAKHHARSALKSLVQFFFMVPAIVLLVAGGSVLASQAHAASGINKQINFQGKLVDNNGLNVADNTYSVVFSLYNTSSGGSATWTETDSVSTSNGVFQVALGAGTPFPGNVDFNSDTWYLGIKVGADLEMTPRIRFSAVPYAFNAAALDGIVATNSATQFTITGGTNALIDLTVNGSLMLGSTIKPTAAGGLTVQSNGANGLTLDTGGAAALAIGATANSITFGATNNPTYSFNGTGAVTFQGTSFTLGNGSTATIQTSSSAGLNILSSGSGNITLGQNAGNGTVVVSPNAGGQASLIVINQGSGDLFTASAGASTKFTISNTGAITDVSYAGANAILFAAPTTGLVTTTTTTTGSQCLLSSTGSSGIPVWGGCGGASASLQTAYNVGQSIDLSQAGTGLTFGTGAGTQNVVIAPNAGGQAGLVVNDQGLGPILTASASGSTVLVLSHGGNLGIGSSNPQQALTLGSADNFVTEMAVPTGATATLAGGGSLAKTSYFYKITASDGTGETIGSTETAACTSTGSTNTCNVSWTAAPNAVSYKIYRTSTSGSYTGTNFLTSVTTTSYSDTGAVTLTAGTPPTVTTAYVTKFSPSGNSWVLGGNVGIGTTTPLAALDIEDGSSGGNAGFIVNQINASTNDILSASAAGTTKFIVHNDGSIQTVGSNATADITTITGGNGLTIMPKANSSGAGGALALKGANGTGAAGGGVIIDAGTGSTNGTISIGTTNQSGLTLGRSGATTTINGSSLVLGVATSVSGALTVTSNTSSALTVGANGSTNPVLQIDASTTSVATGLKILGAATGGTTALSVIDSGTNASLSIDAKGSGTITLGGTSTGAITLGRATGVGGTLTVTSASATALTVGANGSTNPVLTVNASTGSVATGLQVLGAATGGTTALSVTDSGSNANLSLDAKGSGSITIGGTSTGSIIIGGSTNGLTFSTASGPSYAGTGRPTKQIVLSAEYPGAVLTASGSAVISGSMTSDASPSAVTTTANNYENYYMWTATALGSDQQYTVAVRVTLPKDFSDWATGNAITVDYNTPFTNSALNSLDVFIYKGGDTSGKPVAFSKGNVSSVSKNWAQVSFTKTQLTSVTPTLTAAGQQAVFYLTFHSTNTVNYVQVGDITLSYLAAF